MTHHYEIYGFSVSSELHIPEAEALERTNARADIQVFFGDVQELSSSPRSVSFIEVRDEDVLLSLEGIARYRLEHDGRVTVDLQSGAEVRMVRTFLVGIVFAAFMYWQRSVPLHVSAVYTPQGLIAFTGASGAGKSTTAAIINRRTGWPILCDDVAMVKMQQGKPQLRCGLNRLKLWRQKIEMLGLESIEMEPDYFREGKFHLIAPHFFDHSVGALSKLVLLSEGPPKRHLGVEKFFGVLESIYRPEVAHVVGDFTSISRVCAEVADAIEVNRIDGSGILENDTVAIDSFVEQCLRAGTLMD